MTNSNRLLFTTAVAAGLAAAVPASAAWPQPAGARVPRPWRAQDVVDAIGVNTHISYENSAYANTGAVIQALRYLGVTHVREAVPLAQPGDPRLQFWTDLLQAGFKMQLVAPPGNPASGGQPSIASQVVAAVQRLVQAYPGQIAGVEGVNEPDLQNDGYIFTYGSLTGPRAVAQDQIDLYAAMKGNPATASIPVVEFSLNSPPYNQVMYEDVYNADPAVIGAFDIASRGVYAGTWSPGYGVSGQLLNSIDVGRTGTTYTVGPFARQLADKPMAVKETGLTSTSVQPNALGVPDYQTQAKVLPTTLYDALIYGAQHTYVYELADVFADPSVGNVQDHFGLFDNAMRPKTVATVLHNTLSRLQDTSSNAHSFTPAPLNVSIYQFPAQSAGAVPSGYTLEAEKADGTYEILVWYEPLVWNQQTNKPLPTPAPLPIDVFLSKACGTSSVYDPLSNTTTAEPPDSSRLPVMLPDHPVLLTCSPGE